MSFLLHVARCLSSSFTCLLVYSFTHASGRSFAHPRMHAFVVNRAEMTLTATLASTLQTTHCRDILQRHMHLPLLFEYTYACQ